MAVAAQLKEVEVTQGGLGVADHQDALHPDHLTDRHQDPPLECHHVPPEIHTNHPQRARHAHPDPNRQELPIRQGLHLLQGTLLILLQGAQDLPTDPGILLGRQDLPPGALRIHPIAPPTITHRAADPQAGHRARLPEGAADLLQLGRPGTAPPHHAATH